MTEVEMCKEVEETYAISLMKDESNDDEEEEVKIKNKNEDQQEVIEIDSDSSKNEEDWETNNSSDTNYVPDLIEREVIVITNSEEKDNINNNEKKLN